MKTLTIEQMEQVSGGGLLKALSCISQVTGGMSTLGGIALALSIGTGGIGLVLLGLGALSLAASVAVDPYACD